MKATLTRNRTGPSILEDWANIKAGTISVSDFIKGKAKGYFKEAQDKRYIKAKITRPDITKRIGKWDFAFNGERLSDEDWDIDRAGFQHER